MKRRSLKREGERIVEISGLCESPEFRSNLGSLGRESEEIGKNPESLLYTILKIRCYISH